MASKRTIIVTGCSSGIGAASAALLKQGGDTIVGVDINDPATGSVDHFVYMDQSDSGSIEKAIAKLPVDIYERRCAARGTISTRTPSQSQFLRTS
jgi:NAD(P)-dependent dehydrogenase (short-subunit alcohol dehydrogenase family)